MLEMIYRLGIGNVIAAVAGFATLLIANFLAGLTDGDTLGVLQAVLDTQFWLATHVVCITLGYATTYHRRPAGRALHPARRVHAQPLAGREQGAEPHDLRHALLRHVLQLRRHGARRACGPTTRGAASGVGIPRKTAP